MTDINERLKGTWLSSHSQDMSVRVHEDKAVVYDGQRKPYSIAKTDGQWPKPQSDRGNLAIKMVQYVENSLSRGAPYGREQRRDKENKHEHTL